LVEPADYVYAVGDPFQSIFGFAGASPEHLLDWPATKTKNLDRSFRCPADIVALGERILRPTKRYFDRGIAPAAHTGSVERTRWESRWFEGLDVGSDVLCLARTRRQAARFGERLETNGLLWSPIEGTNRWSAPTRNEGLACLWRLQRREQVSPGAWREAIKLLPAKDDEGVQLLARGTKTNFKKSSRDWDNERNDVGGLTEWGATAELSRRVLDGRWTGLVTPSPAKFVATADEHGLDVAMRPPIRVGTVHAAKGLEADTVFYLTTVTHQVHRSMQDELGRDEEARIAYVAVTRAKRRLVILDEAHVSFRTEVPR
ncbi:MAG: 3'-5' exonuclease, partial [Planctomycetota bacterium]